MFDKKTRLLPPAYDITRKAKRTWWGGTKIVPTTKAEQKRFKAEILKRDPHAVILDDRAKKERSLKWIDQIEEFDAFIGD